MNKPLKIALTATVVSALALSSFAAGTLVSINVDPSIKILVNGQEFNPKDVNGNDVMTFTYNGTTYAPLRALAEAYGLEVGYDSTKKMATVSKPKNTDSPEVPASEVTPTPGSLIYSKSGKGDSIIQSVSVTQPSYMVFNTSDDRHHDVKAWYGSGEYDYELLVNSSDPYFGSTYLLGDNVYDFEIKCMGDWSVEIYSIGYTADTEFSGKGDYVTEIFQPATQFYYITYTGSDHFAVKQRYGTGRYDYELLVNQSEPYSGTVRLSHSDLPCFFEISGEEGSWTISPAE